MNKGMVEITDNRVRLGPDWLFHIEEWKPFRRSTVEVYQIFNDSDGEFVGSFAYVPERNKYLNFQTKYRENYLHELWSTFQLGLGWLLRKRRLDTLDI